MKRILTSLVLVASVYSFAQVSISGDDNHVPKATLDVKAIGGKTNGILVPRVSKEEADEMPSPQGGDIEESTLIYVTGDVSGNAAKYATDVDANGFYYFKGGKWVKLGRGSSANIYSEDGTLEGNRAVNQNDNNLIFTTGTGALEINGTSKLMGGSYVNTTVVSSGGNYTVKDSDYYISITSNAQDGKQFDLYIPRAAESNKGRVLIISNHTSNSTVKMLAEGTTTEQIIDGSRSEVINPNKAEWIISDGTKWFNLINY